MILLWMDEVMVFTRVANGDDKVKVDTVNTIAIGGAGRFCVIILLG